MIRKKPRGKAAGLLDVPFSFWAYDTPIPSLFREKGAIRIFRGLITQKAT